MGAMSAVQAVMLGGVAMGRVGEHTKPQDLPWFVLDCMAYDPWIYLGEQAFAAPLRDPTLYFVTHRDPAIRAEAEAVLARIMAKTLRFGTRGVARGVACWVYDWIAEDVQITVQKDGDTSRNKRLVGHQHYDPCVHELHPGEVELQVQADRLVALRYGSNFYRPDRAFVATWDQTDGDMRGNGSRRRAYRSWFRGEYRELWQDRWLERSVDPPRIGRAPAGLVEINGEKVRASDVMASGLMALKGGGAAVFPPTVDKDTKTPLWSVDPMQLPDVSDVWHKAINQTSAEKLIASLVPPGAAGVSETTFAGAKVPYDMFVELLESGAEWVVESVLQPVVDVLHRVNHGDKTPPPLVGAREIPRLKVKRLTELFKVVATVPRRVAGKDGEDGEVSLAELVDESIIDEIGVERRATADAVRKPRPAGPAGGPPGRPRDELGDREQRRENSPNDEGQDDTGGGNVDRQERARRETFTLFSTIAERLTENALAQGESVGLLASAVAEQSRAQGRVQIDAVNIAPPVVQVQAGDVHVPPAPPVQVVVQPPERIIVPPSTVVVEAEEKKEAPAPVVHVHNQVIVPEPKETTKELKVSLLRPDGTETKGKGTIREKPEA